MPIVKRVLTVINTYKPQAPAIAERIAAYLSGRNIDCDIYEYDGLTIDDPFGPYDLAITLGGDGTVLFAARHCARKKIPVFPVNLGEFGFIAGIRPDSWEQALRDYLDGRNPSASRMLLESRVIRNRETVFASDALNDAVISGNGIAKIVRLDVAFDGVSFGLFKADGVIVSTPTGSTAYSAASGGPILGPDLSVFVLTPICSVSLSNRPVVLPSSGEMRITVLDMRHKQCILTVDGQEEFALQEGDTVCVTESPGRISLIGCDNGVFYGALRSKLNWSGTTPAPVDVGFGPSGG
jgi:NAD+ kinase